MKKIRKSFVSRSQHHLFQFYNFSVAGLVMNSCVIKWATNHERITGSMGRIHCRCPLVLSRSYPRYPKGVAKGLRGDTMAHTFRTCATYPILSRRCRCFDKSELKQRCTSRGPRGVRVSLTIQKTTFERDTGISIKI